MYVACSSLCFGDRPLEAALRQIAEFEFNRYDLAIHEEGPHLKPSEVQADPAAARRRLRQGAGLTPSAFDLDFGDVDEATFRARFEAICRFAKPLNVAVLTMRCAPIGSEFEAEVRRLAALSATAGREGLVLSIRTDRDTLTAVPSRAVELCERVPGLGLTLDPSHFVLGPHDGENFDAVFPHVQNVHLRDTGRAAGEEQVRVGQGRVDYARTINLLDRHGYTRSLTVSILNFGDCPFDVDVEVRKLKLLLESLI